MRQLFAIRRPTSSRTTLLLSLASWGVLLTIWLGLTHWDILPPFSLPRPSGVLKAMVRLWGEYDLLGNVLQSWWRIAQAFIWSAAVAIPLGLLMASFPGFTIW